jgi:hypothetical protein
MVEIENGHITVFMDSTSLIKINLSELLSCLHALGMLKDKFSLFGKQISSSLVDIIIESGANLTIEQQVIQNQNSLKIIKKEDNKSEREFEEG